MHQQQSLFKVLPLVKGLGLNVQCDLPNMAGLDGCKYFDTAAVPE